MVDRELARDLGALVVVRVGALVGTGDPGEPYPLVDQSDEPVTALAAYSRCYYLTVDATAFVPVGFLAVGVSRVFATSGRVRP